MAIDVLENPFSDQASISLSEDGVREVGPSMPDTKVQDLIRAADDEVFDKQEGINEKFSLDKEYLSVASHISAELGPYSLSIYEQAQTVVAAAVLRILNEGDRTGSFRGQNASGGSQWDVAQLSTNTWDQDPTNRTYTTRAGEMAVEPVHGVTDPTHADAGPVALDADEQAVFIMGSYASTNPRAIEHAIVGIDDGDDRTASEQFAHQNLGTLQAADYPSVEYITDDDTFQVFASGTQADVATDFAPFGIDINTAANMTADTLFGNIEC